MNSEYNDYMNVSRGTRREKPPGAAEPEGPDPKGTLPPHWHSAPRQDKPDPRQAAYSRDLADEGRPLGAYEMIDRVRSDRYRPAPISIYRALDSYLKTALSIGSRLATLSPAAMGTPRRSRSCSHLRVCGGSSRRPPRRCAGSLRAYWRSPLLPPRTGDGSRRPMPSLRTGIIRQKVGILDAL